jgi:hypothetical protein
MSDYEKKAIEELKKVVPAVEAAIVAEVNGKECSCWGWTLRITRCPKALPPAKPTESAKSDSTSVTPSAPTSV